MILGIDPGKRGLAITALNVDGTFRSVRCWALPKDPLKHVAMWGLGPYAYLRDFASHAARVYCEQMVYYPQLGSAKASSELKAILVLQAIGGLVCGWTNSPQVVFRPAAAWKGQLPKAICHARLRKLLSTSELGTFLGQIAQYKKQDDCWDSLGVALSGAGRFRA